MNVCGAIYQVERELTSKVGITQVEEQDKDTSSVVGIDDTCTGMDRVLGS